MAARVPPTKLPIPSDAEDSRLFAAASRGQFGVKASPSGEPVKIKVVTERSVGNRGSMWYGKSATSEGFGTGEERVVTVNPEDDMNSLFVKSKSCTGLFGVHDEFARESRETLSVAAKLRARPWNPVSPELEVPRVVVEVESVERSDSKSNANFLTLERKFSSSPIESYLQVFPNSEEMFGPAQRFATPASCHDKRPMDLIAYSRTRAPERDVIVDDIIVKFGAKALASLTYFKVDDDSAPRFIYLKNNEEGKSELFCDDVLLVGANQVHKPSRLLTDVDKAKAEAKRSWMKGIESLRVLKSAGNIKIQLNLGGGAVGLYDMAEEKLDVFEDIGQDAQFDLSGSFVGYVDLGNLYIKFLGEEQTLQLTFDGSECCTNGVAEFVAMEEFDRYDGYWISPSGSVVAYTKVDDSNVHRMARLDGGKTVKTMDMSYPVPGTPNAKVRLAVQRICPKYFRLVGPAEFPIEDLPSTYRDEMEMITKVVWVDRTLLILSVNRNQSKLFLYLWKNREANFNHLKVKPADGCEWQTVDDQNVLIEWSDSKWRWFDCPTFIDHTTPGCPDFSLGFQWGTQRMEVGAGRLHVATDSWPDNPFIYSMSRDPYVLHCCHPTPPEEPISLFSSSLIPPFYGRYVQSNSAADGYRIVPEYQLNEIADIRIEVPTGDEMDHGPIKLAANHELAHLIPRFVIPIYFELRSDKHHDLMYGQLWAPRDDTITIATLIVGVYGGPHSTLVNGRYPRDQLMIQYLAQQGFAYWRMDNRGTSNRSRRFEQAVHRKLGSLEVEDQATGVETVKRILAKMGITVNKVVVWGHSYGGYLALMCLFKLPKVFDAAIAGAPVTSWELYDTGYTERYMDELQKNEAGYEKSDVVQYVKNYDDTKQNLLVYHGTADDNVVYQHTMRLDDALVAHGKMYSSVAYHGEKHSVLGVRQHLNDTIFGFLNDVDRGLTARRAQSCTIDLVT